MIQFDRNLPVPRNAVLAMPAAMAEVRPDWMTPKTKWA